MGIRVSRQWLQQGKLRQSLAGFLTGGDKSLGDQGSWSLWSRGAERRDLRRERTSKSFRDLHPSIYSIKYFSLYESEETATNWTKGHPEWWEGTNPAHAKLGIPPVSHAAPVPSTRPWFLNRTLGAPLSPTSAPLPPQLQSRGSRCDGLRWLLAHPVFPPFHCSTSVNSTPCHRHPLWHPIYYRPSKVYVLPNFTLRIQSGNMECH